MDGYETAVSLLPQEYHAPLLLLREATRCRVQEIRLRAGQAVALGLGGEEWYVTAAGGLTTARTEGILCDAARLQQTAERLYQYSAYAHKEELSRGFITAKGCRVGIAGTAVVENGHVRGYRALTALCIRVARAHNGCAASLVPLLCDGGAHSALLCGEPASGKTCMLRDLALSFAKRRLPVTVVDERGELSACGELHGCDVLCYAPKAAGLLQAVRCLAPRAVLLDELGDGDELEAVSEGALRGVPTIATVHCRTPHELWRREGMRAALERGVFEYVIVLKGRAAAGQIACVLRTEDWLYEMARGGAVVNNGTGSRVFGTA